MCYVKEQNFKLSKDVLTAMKEMFANVLQEALEAEMDAHLSYDRHEISDKRKFKDIYNILRDRCMIYLSEF